ncbi:zinc transporter ZntB [Oceaniglobus roseus]|uniref:zinc transporter ZntB n=1 Tax=Oceaniglobus roseus TaxID=1737570 RepID=UPI000C7F736F|nr:zinc transporter ZntB [Kandeliimicrobium roseum]
MLNFIHFAHALGEHPRWKPLRDHHEIAAALEAPEPAWLHLHAEDPGTRPWIDENLSYLDPSIRAALTQPETRPRAVRIGDGLLVILRGINMDPGEDPEDMISVRMWIDPARIVSLSRRKLASVMQLDRECGEGKGPKDAGSFLAHLIEQLTTRIETQIDDLDDRTESLEAAVIGDPNGAQGAELSDLRLEAIDLRQYMGPQRDAIRDVLASGVDWLTEAHRSTLNEQHSRMTRVVEELEATRDQLQAIRDELGRAMDERLNRNLYILSVISAVFLPLGFLTGLMGINLAGMPGANWPPAFWVFTASLAVLSAAIVVLLWCLKLVRPRR